MPRVVLVQMLDDVTVATGQASRAGTETKVSRKTDWVCHVQERGESSPRRIGPHIGQRETYSLRYRQRMARFDGGPTSETPMMEFGQKTISISGCPLADTRKKTRADAGGGCWVEGGT